ncbi:MAG: c-type cytochrome biogenesis protein CcsB [Verrucomicrobia bacterium]|nr:c-type cytochrome biogenesis protein CcsB [Verrucomicrobiota bacterium]
MELTFNLSLVGYLAASLFAAINLFSKNRQRLATVVTATLIAAVTVQTVYMGLRWIAAERAPFSNMFESLVLFAWAVVVVHLALRIRLDVPVLGVVTALFAALTLAYASTFFESAIKPLMPALRSNWLAVHVFTCFMGYGAFALASAASVAYLIVARAGAPANGTAAALDTATAKTISFGFLFLTAGIITGAVWANSAWGTYWSWDPKETWSLITWFIYAVFMHCRFMRGWSGRRAAWVSIAGFASVVFTYFGVNYLLSGLHSYAK